MGQGPVSQGGVCEGIVQSVKRDVQATGNREGYVATSSTYLIFFLAMVLGTALIASNTLWRQVRVREEGRVI